MKAEELNNKSDETRSLEMVNALRSNIASVFLGNEKAIDDVLVALFSGGHLLIEDVPGVGKTTLAHALARSIGGTYRRIQFTSDLLPSDIIGVNLFNQNAKDFRFVPGPLFANVVLADEINRTNPKTQSALLEAMGEEQVTVDGESHPVPDPFLVIATQNSFEYHGTYPLPESELDRFFMCIDVGYPERDSEKAIVGRLQREDPVRELGAVIFPQDVIDIRTRAQNVKLDESLLDYILDLAEQTRKSDLFSLGVSPRGAMYLHRAARAHALLQGRQFCIPDDIKNLVLLVWSHRVVPSGMYSASKTGDNAKQILRDMIDTFPVPL